ncbi:enhancer of split malpha protein [Episyrphus balteatus]|uniref:enhancer of split malpha protein n=1 Tax=Episyrphus balteatus TaxID=286459 RepID=UPI0024852BDB|nr:enhancer of split malpha protein [Episyrphus balteatus]
MCIVMPEQQTTTTTMVSTLSKKSASYSIKRVLKAIFKKQQKQQKHTRSLESLESLENLRNSQTEVYYTEIEDNSANEKLVHFILEESEQQQQTEPKDEGIYVPVRFARTEVGTFFWTTNLQPVMSIVPAADEDLVQPAYCYSNSQYPQLQFGDRWAQA